MRIFILLCALLVPACGGADEIGDHENGTTDSVIGDPCATNGDCLERCLTDPGDFPGGFCTVSCASDADCPADTTCADKAGGVCLFSCPAFDCAFLGAGYRCDNKDHVSGGQVNVCIAD